MKRLLAALVASLAVAACTVAGTKIENPLTQVQDKANALVGNKNCTPEELRRYALSADNEYWFGRSVAARMISRYLPDKVYEPDSPAAVYVNEVGQAVAAGAVSLRDPGGMDTGPRRFASQQRIQKSQDDRTWDDFAGDRPEPTRGYHFILVKDPAPVAFGLPGGFVILSDGMVARAKTEDQLAGVLAHELAHVQRGHGVLDVQRAMCSGDATALQEVRDQMKHGAEQVTFANTSMPMEKAVGLVNDLSAKMIEKLVQKGYGTTEEQEADAFGVRYLAASGYSASALPEFLRAVDKDPAFQPHTGNAAHLAPHLRAGDLEKEIAAEKLDPAHSPDEPRRADRFKSAFATR